MELQCHLAVKVVDHLSERCLRVGFGSHVLFHNAIKTDAGGSRLVHPTKCCPFSHSSEDPCQLGATLPLCLTLVTLFYLFFTYFFFVPLSPSLCLSLSSCHFCLLVPPVLLCVTVAITLSTAVTVVSRRHYQRQPLTPLTLTLSDVYIVARVYMHNETVTHSHFHTVIHIHIQCGAVALIVTFTHQCWHSHSHRLLLSISQVLAQRQALDGHTQTHRCTCSWGVRETER